MALQQNIGFKGIELDYGYIRLENVNVGLSITGEVKKLNGYAMFRVYPNKEVASSNDGQNFIDEINITFPIENSSAIVTGAMAEIYKTAKEIAFPDAQDV